MLCITRLAVRHVMFVTGGIQLGISAKGECLRHWFKTLKDVNQAHEHWHVLSPEQFGSES